MVGWVITVMNAAGFWCRRSTAATVFGSHQGENPPACAHCPRRSRRRAGRPSPLPARMRANFSPTALPIELPMKAKSMTASSQGLRSMLAVPAMSALSEPRSHLGLGNPLRIRTEIEEAERIGGAQILVLLPRTCPGRRAGRPRGERAPGSGDRTAGRPRGSRRAPRPGEWQLGQVFGFSRAAPAGPAVLDGDVDPAGHDRPILEVGTRWALVAGRGSGAHLVQTSCRGRSSKALRLDRSERGRRHSEDLRPDRRNRVRRRACAGPVRRGRPRPPRESSLPAPA